MLEPKPRPMGRSPKGKVWDSCAGAWIASEAGRRLSQESPSARPKNLRKTPKSREFLSDVQERRENR